MHPFIQYTIVRNIVKYKLKNKIDTISAEDFENEVQNIKVEFSHWGSDIFFMLLGVVSASFAKPVSVSVRACPPVMTQCTNTFLPFSLSTRTTSFSRM